MSHEDSLATEDRYYLETLFAKIGAKSDSQKIDLLHAIIRAHNPEYCHPELEYDSHLFYVSSLTLDTTKIIQRLCLVAKRTNTIMMPSHNFQAARKLAEESKLFDDGVNPPM